MMAAVQVAIGNRVAEDLVETEVEIVDHVLGQALLGAECLDPEYDPFDLGEAVADTKRGFRCMATCAH
jgi:hypothetical protein